MEAPTDLLRSYQFSLLCRCESDKSFSHSQATWWHGCCDDVKAIKWSTFPATYFILVFKCNASSRYHHPKMALWLATFTRGGRPWATWCTHAMAASSRELRCSTAASLACRLQRPRPSSPGRGGWDEGNDLAWCVEIWREVIAYIYIYISKMWIYLKISQDHGRTTWASRHLVQAIGDPVWSYIVSYLPFLESFTPQQSCGSIVQPCATPSVDDFPLKPRGIFPHFPPSQGCFKAAQVVSSSFKY